MNNRPAPAPDLRHRAIFWLMVVGLFLLCAAVRLYRLDVVDLRGDEGYTAIYWISTPFTKDWMVMLKGDPYPFGVFFLYWGWAQVAGDSVLALRYLSVLGNVGGLAALLILSRRLLKEWRWALLIGLLWTLNPFYLWHAQDARMYGILSLFNTLNFYLLLKALDKPRSETRIRGWRPWWAYFACQLLTLYLYFFEALALLAQGVFVLALRRRDLIIEAGRTWVVMMLCAIPAFVQLYWIVAVTDYLPNAETATITAYFENFLPNYFFGETVNAFGIGVGLFLMVIIGLVLTWRDTLSYPRNLLLAMWILVPPIALFILSLRAEYFRPRYAITSLPALYIALMLAVIGMGRLWQARWQHPVPLFGLGIVVTLIIGGVSVHEINDYFYHDPPKARDWSSLAAYLHTRTTADDVVVIGDPDPTLEYYYRGPGEVFVRPLDVQDAAEEVAYLTEHYQALFLLAGSRIGDLEAILRDQWQHIPGDTFPGITQYRPWTVDPAEIQHPLAVTFADVATLRGYTLLEGESRSTTILLYWEPLKQTETPHSILVHILPASNPDGIPVAVLDHGVANAIISTTQWLPAILYRDPIVTPLELPPGDYLIRVGIYETTTQTPVPLADTSSDYDGRYSIGNFRVRE